MRRAAMSMSVLLVVLVLLSTAAADAARTIRHSGTVLSIDSQSRVMVVEEVGPWRLEHGKTVVARRTISLTPQTRFNLFMRADVPGDYPGNFIEVALDRSDVSRGDFVTVDCVHKGRRLVALTVTVADVPAME